jgi:hypothetical protein
MTAGILPPPSGNLNAAGSLGRPPARCPTASRVQICRSGRLPALQEPAAAGIVVHCRTSGEFMRTAVALVALIAVGGAALAQVTPSGPAPTPAADVKAGATVTKTGADKKGRKTRRPNGDAKTGDTATNARGTGNTAKSLDLGGTLASCLELWEPATHMTRQEWGRACRRVDERLKAISLR